MAEEWIEGVPVQTDNTNQEWVLGTPFVVTEEEEPSGVKPWWYYKQIESVMRRTG